MKNLRTQNKCLIILIVLLFIWTFINLFYPFPQCVTLFNLFSQDDKLLFKIVAFANICLVAITLLAFFQTRKSVDLARSSNERAEKVYVGQNKPLIDITPIALGQSSAGTHVAIELSVSNYSGFKAFNIGFDVRYGEQGWHGEWIKASEQPGGVKRGYRYDPLPKIIIPILKSGATIKAKPDSPIFSSGVLNLENDVCICKNGEIIVQIRVRWENKNHHVFDEVHEYKLICTKASKNNGRSFTFIPVGVVSKKSLPLDSSLVTDS